MAYGFDTLASLALIIVVGYTVFGLTGFGSSVTSMPLLVLFIPLRTAVPLMLVFDLCASLLLGLNNWRFIARREALRLVPFMLVGMGCGVLALVHAPERSLLVLLGVFILAYAGWGLLARGAPRPLGTIWAAPFGVVGGIFTALFGTGGPFYTIYLTRRLQDKLALRATISGVLFFSAITRVVLFTGAGLYKQPGVLPLAALLLPCALGGLYLGNRLHHRLPAERIRQAIWVVLTVGGVSLVLHNA
ncbi:MAG TPA: sulfite exporter TauE/SafE family protein [Telluria sp.]